MLKRIGCFLLLLSLIILQTGCWDRNELEDLAYVIGLGVDIPDDDPTSRIITFNIVVPKNFAGGEAKGGGKSFFTLSVRAPGIFAGFELAQAAVARRLSLTQCRSIFIAESLAKEGIMPFAAVVARNTELRRDISLFVVSGCPVEKFMQKDVPLLAGNIARYFEEASTTIYYTGFTTLSTFHKVMEGFETPGENAIVTLAGIRKESKESENPNAIAGEVPRTEGKDTEHLGVAVFKGEKMVGKLGKSETQILSLIRGDWLEGPFSMPDPDLPRYPIGGRMRKAAKPKFEVDLESDPVKINVDLSMVLMGITSQLSKTDYSTPENWQRLEKDLAIYIEEKSTELIKKAQTDYNSDIFRFGSLAVKKKFHTYKEWEQFNWPDKFPQAEVTVTAHVRIPYLGLQAGQPMPTE